MSEMMMPETIKLLASTKSKITKDENVPHSEVTDAMFVHCNIFNNNFQLDSRVLYKFFPTNSLVNY